MNGMGIFGIPIPILLAVYIPI